MIGRLSRRVSPNMDGLAGMSSRPWLVGIFSFRFKCRPLLAFRKHPAPTSRPHQLISTSFLICVPEDFKHFNLSLPR